MAKSIRSKSKRAFRRVKRESGVFATADAARLHRISTKLQAKIKTDGEGDISLPQVVEDATENEKMKEVTTEKPDEASGQEAVDLAASAPKKISTSGRRLSRRDEWRLSKGKPIHRKNSAKVNRLGGVAAKRRAGRSKRRR